MYAFTHKQAEVQLLLLLLLPGNWLTLRARGQLIHSDSMLGACTHPS